MIAQEKILELREALSANIKMNNNAAWLMDGLKRYRKEDTIQFIKDKFFQLCKNDILNDKLFEQHKETLASFGIRYNSMCNEKEEMYYYLSDTDTKFYFNEKRNGLAHVYLANENVCVPLDNDGYYIVNGKGCVAAMGETCVDVLGDIRITAYNYAKCNIFENTKYFGLGKSIVNVCDYSCEVELYDFATAHFYVEPASSHVTAHGDSLVVFHFNPYGIKFGQNAAFKFA